MRISVFAVLIFICLNGRSQDTYTLFPKSNYRIILPNPGFLINWDSSGFFNEKYSSTIELETGEEIGEYDYDVLVEFMLKECSMPGVTLLLDKKISKNLRILKTKIEFDITDQSPVKKGNFNISWMLLFNDNGKPVAVFAEYRLKHDAELGELFLRSLSSFSKE